ncbi:MAG: CHAT domain-containing protein [Candidatus Zixiibacteriota bacterium]
MRRAIAEILFFILTGAILFFGCSSETDITELYHKNNSATYLEKINSDHFQIRQFLLSRLSDYLELKSVNNTSAIDSSHDELDWYIDKYNKATGIRDLSFRLSSYTSWDSAQAMEIINLRQSQAKLLRSRDSLSLSDMRDQLRNLYHQFSSLNDSIYLAVVTKDMAQIYEAHGAIDSAINYYHICIAISKNLDYYSLIGNCEMMLGRIYNYRLADYLHSEIAYSNSIRSFRKIDDKRYIPYVQLGRIYDFLQLYQTETAITLIHNILPELKNRKDISNQAYCYYFLSVAYNNLGILDSALYFGRESLALRQEMATAHSSGLSDLGYSLSQLGLVNQYLGNHKSAIELYRSADSIFELAQDPGGAAVNLISRGNYFIENKSYDSAQTIFEKISDAYISYENLIFSRYGIALCSYFTGNTERAIIELKNCIRLIENTNRKLPIPELKTGIFSDKIGFYNLLSAIYIQKLNSTAERANADSAFIYLEQSKSRALMDNLSGNARMLTDSIENHYLHRIAEIHKDSRTTGEITATMKAIHELEDSLLLNYLENSEQIVNNSKTFDDYPINIASIQNRIQDDNTVILEYLLSYYGNFIFVIGKGEYTIRKIDEDFDSIQVLIGNHIDAIDSYPETDISQNDFMETGKRLYSILIPDDLLKAYNAKKLIAIPSGPIHYLPLESLIDKNDEFLIEQFDVSYAPSAKGIRPKLTDGNISDKSFTMVAFASSPELEASDGNIQININNSSEQAYWIVDHLAPLPYCSIEVQTIAQCFGSNKVKTFIGSEATERNLKSADFSNTKYLHIAAHGITNDRMPNRSAIILSTNQNDDDDGILQPREITQLEIPIQLVFLSSCRSGRGKYFPGEGVLNLARPFLIAGCNSAIVTYWNISDITTSEFTEYFYQNILKGHSHAHALARAKQQFIESRRAKLRHPYFWAPYILIGS